MHLCIIDDAFIAFPEGLPFDIQACLTREYVEKIIDTEDFIAKDSELRNFTKGILSNWDSLNLKKLSVYTQPKFFFIDQPFISTPDIVIFDWEYKITLNVKDELKRLLLSSYCKIFIYTEIDNIEDIKFILVDQFLCNEL